VTKPDIPSTVAYVTGGGVAGIFACLDIFFPAHSSQINGFAIALVAAAGLYKSMWNPTPTNTAQVYDRTSGTLVDIKTVAPAEGPPAPPPVYATQLKGPTP
jgi:hypothetical protein